MEKMPKLSFFFCWKQYTPNFAYYLSQDSWIVWFTHLVSRLICKTYDINRVEFICTTCV